MLGPYDGKGPQDLSGGGELESSSDPIARNPKDIDEPKGSDNLNAYDEPKGSDNLHAYLDSALGEPQLRDRAGSVGIGRNGDALAVRRQVPFAQQHVPSTASPTELLASVLRYKWTILLLFVLVSAPSIAGIWTQIAPLYGARAELQVSPVIPALIGKDTTIPFYESFVNTQVSIVRSPTVLNRVLDRDDVKETGWYKNPPQSLIQQVRGDQLPAMERLRGNLSVRPRRRTEIIDISFADNSPKEAELLVDAVLEEYIKFSGERTDATRANLDRQLAAEYELLQSQIQTKERLCAGIRKDIRTSDPKELIDSQRLRLDAMDARLRELGITIALLEKQITERQSVDSNDASADAGDNSAEQPAYHVDQEWRQRDLNVKTLQHEIANGIHGAKHPETIRLTRNLKFAEELRQERQTQLDEQWKDGAGSGVGDLRPPTNGDLSNYAGGVKVLQYQLNQAKNEKDLREPMYEQQKQAFDKLVSDAQRLEEYSNELRHLYETFEKVRQSITQRAMDRKVPHTIAVLTHAFSRDKPTKDRRTVFTAMALFVGLGIGGGVAFLRATRNQTIYAVKDMPQDMQVPFLGHIPLVHNKELPGKSLCKEIKRNQVHLFESIRVLRTALLSRLDHQGPATVLITSADEGTGKSSFTMMLGKSLALSGKKVLLIDVDFHKMTLSERFDLLDRVGLRESLRHEAVDGEAIVSTEIPNLDVLPAGKQNMEEGVFEELANGTFRAYTGRLLDRYGYEIILVDSPPLLPVADATVLVGQVDGTIMVERENASIRTHVASALNRLHLAGGRLLGTVFVGSSRREHYGYGYSYGYGSYGSKTKES